MAKKSKQKNKKQHKESHFSLGGFLLKWVIVLGLWVMIGFGLLVAWYGGELPQITQAADFERKSTITIKAYDGSILARYGELRGQSVTVEDLPPHLIYAVLAIEDRRFYQHFGLDPIGLARAVWVNVQAGRLVQGGSTITQQLAKNLFLNHERTVKRKIQEALLALWLEQELTKDEILSAYFNRVYLGSGAYGVDAAARLYFDKPATEVDLQEAAILAGLLKAPSRYSPSRNPELARQRANVVLNAMAESGYITQTKAKMLSAVTAEEHAEKYHKAARYFTDWVVDNVNALIGTPQEDLVIETTLRPAIQDTVQDTLRKAIDTARQERSVSQGAAIVMAYDGAILAMSGGYDYAESQFNRAVQAIRQPGSAFKPIVFLAAFEEGAQPRDLVLDEPITEGTYRPKNFNDLYKGVVELDEALTLSLNTATVRLMRETGPDKVINLAHRLGIHSPLDSNLSLALGSSGVIPLEIASAYGVIANDGLAVFPYAITKITNEAGDLYYQRHLNKARPRVVEKQYVRPLRKILENVIAEGTGKAAQLPFFVAGKTGTSQNYRDAWFAGFSDELVSVVWLGNDNNEPMKGVTGGSIPAVIWRDIMREARANYTPEDQGARQDEAFGNFLERLFSSEPAGSHEQQTRYNN